jgi:hypothetical protein
VLTADPFDLALHLEQVWYTPGVQGGWQLGGAGRARQRFWELGAFNDFAPTADPWEHLGYSYVLENTRAVQIFRRVVQGYRSGEALGVPSRQTQQWLDTTEALLFGAANPVAAWLSTSSIRPEAENVRRNAYWRLFGLDLAFGTEDNRPPNYDKAAAANTNFAPLFEELLFELWQAMANSRNTSGVNSSDDDRIYRLAEELRFNLQSRRQANTLAREELAASLALGWVDLTLSVNSAVVLDLRAQATNAADRLKLIGERVGLAAHSRSAALFSMANSLSLFLRTIESGVVNGPALSWFLYSTTPPAQAARLPPGVAPIGPVTHRVITEWAAATGKDIKVRAKPVEIVSRARLTAVK